MYIYYRYVDCKFKNDPYDPCKARGKYVNNTVILNVRHHHMCDPSADLVHLDAFQNALFEVIQTDTRKTAFAIYKSVAQR